MSWLDVLRSRAQAFELDPVVSIVLTEHIPNLFGEVLTFRKIGESRFALFLLTDKRQQRVDVQKPSQEKNMEF